jgi:thiol-disulfide isomerase/thioredoxin
MRRRSSFLIALLVCIAGACTPAPNSGGQTATIAQATPTTVQTSTAMNRPTRYAPPGLLPAARRKPAPALQVTAFDGRTVSLAGLRGRPVVVSFFESWCGTCQAEQPDLTKVAGDFAGRVGFVGVSYRDTVAAGRAYQRRFKVPYPLANDASGRPGRAGGCPTSQWSSWSTSTAGSPSASTVGPPAAPWPPP